MSIFSSARWVGISQAAKVVCQITSMVVLTKLLHPSDYGLMALAMVVASFAFIFKDLGTGTAIIQKKSLTQSEISTIFWFNIVVGFSLGLLLVIFSSYISQFFHESRLSHLILLTAIVFPIASGSVVHQALMERQSKFKSLAMMESINQLLCLGTAIAFAYAGAGVYSLIIPLVLSSILTSLWLWNISTWRPSLHWSKAEFKEVMGFSGNLSIFNFVEYFSSNTDSIIIGKLLGTLVLGAYSLAYKIMLFPIQNLTWIVNRVLLPALCGLQDDKNAAKALYFKSLHLILTITAPLMVGIWVLRVPFVDSVFGHKWELVGLLLAWLAPVGLIQSAVHTTGVVFTAYGRTGLLLRLGIFSLGINLIAFISGAQFGLIPLAACYLIANVINLIVCTFYLLKTLDATFIEITHAFKWPLIASAIMGLTIMIVKNSLTHNLPSAVQVIAGTVVGLFTYFLLMHSASRASIHPVLKLMKIK